ncbi:MAG: hypothetical protein ABW056_12590 [Thermoanaerobaculia bacterium]
MPITYRIDRELNRILTRCTGETVLKEVLGHFAELEADPDCPPRADVLLDLREITNLPNVGQIRAAAERTGDASRKVGFGAIAIVVGTEAWFGMARVFEAFTEAHFERTSVFRSIEAAEVWLDGGRPH